MTEFIPWIWVLLYLITIPLVLFLSFRSKKGEKEASTEEDPKKQDPMLRKYFLVYLLVAIGFGFVIYRISYIQNIEGDALRGIAKERLTNSDTVKAIRGNILSDDGRLLSSSLPYYYLYLDTRVEALHVKNRKTGKTYFEEHVGELADSLGKKFGKSPAVFEKNLRKAYKQRRASYRIYPDAVSHIDYLQIKRFPILKRGAIQGGFSSKMRIKRKRPYGSLAARTIGGIYGEGGKGKNGLEMAYDSLLQGEYGLKVARKKAGKRIDIILKEPVNGMDVVSTINIDIQEVAERALREKLAWSKSERGTVVLMETATGKVKAISNLQWSPIFNEYIEAQNIAVASQIEPGSTFKTVSMLVAMEDGHIDTSSVVDTHDGSVIFADRKMRDWNYRGTGKGGFGIASVAKIMQQSSNVGVSVLIQQFYEDHPEKFIAGVKKTGFATPVKLEIPGYGKVKLKTPGNKDWYGTTLPWMSIGYELQVPPIYTLMFYNAIANNGKMVKPIFTEEIRKGGKVYRKTETEVVQESIASAENIKKIQGVLESVVTKGTAKGVQSKLFTAAGKTGTSQIFEGGTKYNKEGKVRHQVTFCGYFPADHPMYSCIVYARDPKIGGAGSICGAVFKEVAEKAIILNTERKDTTQVNPSKPIYLSEKQWIQSLDTLASYELPSMKGWSIDKALYVLENKGIEVTTEGFGTVKSQSIQAGTPIEEVNRIHLILAMP